MKNPDIGQRKFVHARTMALMLLLGFIIAVLCKAPAELFVTLVSGLGIQSGAFVWGNSKEHASKAAQVKTTSLPAAPVAAGSPGQTAT